MNREIFTSANLAYLPQALVLLSSVRRFEPGARMTLVLVDEFPEDLRLVRALHLFDDVLLPRDLLGEDYLRWLFRFEVVEACTAVKGLALQRLVETGSRVVYLDPDTVLFSDLNDVWTALESSSVVLTPHQLAPAVGRVGVRDEITSLQTGVYNFGFLAVAASDEGRRFASWWAERLDEWCLDEPALGLFTDQKWGNLVPVLFPASGVLRHPGMNVASWNLHERCLTVSPDGEYMVNGYPLILFHFTKARHVGSAVTRVKAQSNPLVAHLWSAYLRDLAQQDKMIPACEWAFSRYRNGQRGLVLPADRRAYRERPPEQRAAIEPFGHD